MSSINTAVVKTGAIQPTAALAPIPFCSPQAGELLTDDGLNFNSTERALVIPLLTADPATSPAANTVMAYVVFTGGAYTLRIKNSAGVVKSVALA